MAKTPSRVKPYPRKEAEPRARRRSPRQARAREHLGRRDTGREDDQIRLHLTVQPRRWQCPFVGADTAAEQHLDATPPQVPVQQRPSPRDEEPRSAGPGLPMREAASAATSQPAPPHDQHPRASGSHRPRAPVQASRTQAPSPHSRCRRKPRRSRRAPRPPEPAQYRAARPGHAALHKTSAAALDKLADVYAIFLGGVGVGDYPRCSAGVEEVAG